MGIDIICAARPSDPYIMKKEKRQICKLVMMMMIVTFLFV